MIYDLREHVIKFLQNNLIGNAKLILFLIVLFGLFLRLVFFSGMGTSDDLGYSEYAANAYKDATSDSLTYLAVRIGMVYATSVSYSLFGIFYIGFLFSFWPKIRALPQGVHWILLVFLICWLTDVFAFFIGKGWGRKKLAENLSPNKTVEGALAGIAASTIGVVIYKMTFFHELSWLDSFILGIIGSIFSQIGDLFESFVKRSFSVKDSGVVIPGHGGILDRFDGVLFCAPFLYFYARFW